MVPDAAVRQTVFATAGIPRHQRTIRPADLRDLLRSNGLSEPRFLDMVRGELAAAAIAGGGHRRGGGVGKHAAPALREPVRETLRRHGRIPVRRRARTGGADGCRPAALVRQPPEPVLRRPSTAASRRSCCRQQTLAKEIPITDADLHTAYHQHIADYVKPEKRSAEVISVSDEAKANALAATLAGRRRLGGDAEGSAKDAGGSAISLDDATQSQFPDPDLAKTVFAAARDR